MRPELFNIFEDYIVEEMAQPTNSDFRFFIIFIFIFYYHMYVKFSTVVAFLGSLRFTTRLILDAASVIEF